jgi:hypothetical protein
MLSKHIVPTEFEREKALFGHLRYIDQTRAYSRFGEYPVIS